MAPDLRVLHARLQDSRAARRHSGARRSPAQRALFRRSGRIEAGKWEMTCKSGCRCGREWDTFAAASRAGGAPPTPPARLSSFSHGLSRHLRLLPRRKEPAHGAGALSRRPVGRRRAREGLERCVALWTPRGYDEYTQASLAGFHPLSPEAQKLKRFFSANSLETELDAAGRVMLPAFLLEHAGLDKEVVVTGSGDALEIWRPRHLGGVQRRALIRRHRHHRTPWPHCLT